MTKKQNRFRGFGKRSLSLVLAMLLVLSAVAVMVTYTVSAAGNKTVTVGVISYLYNDPGSTGWQVRYWGGSDGTGDANLTATGGTKSKQLGSSYWSNAAQTFYMYTAQIPSDATGFKIHRSDRWFGDDNTDTSKNAAYIFNYSGDKAIYETVSTPTPDPTTPDPTTPEPTPSGDADFTVGVGTANGGNIFWADAYYYDYLSDAELGGNWLKPQKVGTNWNNSGKDSDLQNEWYPFYNFNRYVVRDNAGSWSTPLYFGNFCNTWNAYDNPHHVGMSTGSGYDDATKDPDNVTRFNYAANNSNGVYDMYTSYQDLMAASLDNGKLMTSAGTTAPYFDRDLLGDYAKVIKSKFPFRIIDMGGYTRYEFDSTSGTNPVTGEYRDVSQTDNVYFTWGTDASGKPKPTSVNYGQGGSYAITDGVQDFMTLNDTNGTGIFPFNRKNNSDANSGRNNNLDYGFGIRMDMKFRVPDSTNVKFDFSGDDDLWLYITDDSGESNLVLDMGGSHKMSTGVVNFAPGGTVTATVDKVDNRSASNRDLWVQDVNQSWGNVKVYASDGGSWHWFTGQKYDDLYRFRDDTKPDDGADTTLGQMTTFKIASDTNWASQYPSGMGSNLSLSTYTGSTKKVLKTDGGTFENPVTVGGHSEPRTKTFTLDYSKTYTMTIFYMERGLIESNCKMGFTITPLGNNFIVTERVDAVDVNAGLQDDVTQLSTFGFRTSNNGSQISDSFYKDFTLSNGSRFDIPSTILPINSNPSITQYAPENSYLKYTSAWDYHDNVSSGTGSNNSDSIGTVDKATGATTSTDSHTLINSSGNEYDYAEWQVDYVNKPVVTDVSITKDVDDDSGADHSGETFPATVYIKLSDESGFKAYDNLEIVDDGEEKTVNGGRVELRDDKTIVIPNVPVGARVYVEEDSDPNYDVNYTATQNNPLTAGSGSITVTNTPKNPDSIPGQVEGAKLLDDNRYNGTMFRFVLEGVAPMTGDPENAVDTSGVMLSTDSTDRQGRFTITGLSFSAPGLYRYHVYEDLSKLADLDAASGNTYYQSDIYGVVTDFLVSITVHREIQNGEPVLVADAPVYYNYSPYEDMVAMPGASGEPTPHIMTPDDFSENKKVSGSLMVFSNETMKGSVTINKTDQSNNTLDGVTFSVYAVDQAFLDSLEGKTDVEKYDLVKALTPVKTTVTGAGSFGAGVGLVLDLPIYEGTYYRSSAPSYQKYIMIETNGPSDYSINKTLMQFSFPTMGDDDELHYDLTYDYINGILKSPSTSGTGMTLFKIIGMSLLGLSVLALGAYMLISKKRRYGKHFIK